MPAVVGQRWRLGVLIFGNARAISVAANFRRCVAQQPTTIGSSIGRLRLLAMVGLVVICGFCACDRVGRPLVRVAECDLVARPPAVNTTIWSQLPVSEAARAGWSMFAVLFPMPLSTQLRDGEQFHRHTAVPARARCLAHESMAEGSGTAAAVLRPHGRCYLLGLSIGPRRSGQDDGPQPGLARPYAHSHEAGRWSM